MSDNTGKHITQVSDEINFTVHVSDIQEINFSFTTIIIKYSNQY